MGSCQSVKASENCKVVSGAAIVGTALAVMVAISALLALGCATASVKTGLSTGVAATGKAMVFTTAQWAGVAAGGLLLTVIVTSAASAVLNPTSDDHREAKSDD